MAGRGGECFGAPGRAQATRRDAVHGRCTNARSPASTPKTREQKRFGRADKDDDGRITAAELFDPRRKAFAKLDTNGNGTLGFEEWAAKTVTKFASADKDRSGWLTPAEYATTAPPPPKKQRCSC